MKTKGKTAVKKMLAILVMVYTMIICSAFSVSAAGITTADTETAVGTTFSAQGGGDGWGAVENWISNATSHVKTIGYALAGLCVVILGIIFITGGGQALQKGKGMAIGILAGVAVISFGVGLIGSLQG